VATIDVLDATGAKKAGTRELPADVFEATVSVPLMHQVVVAGMAGIRRGTQSTKTRGDVSGGGRKPWRQKGTGRARQGSIRSPQWVGGGVAHGPHPRSHEQRVNKKMKRGALRGALTDAAATGKLAVVRGLSFDEPKTKRAAELLETIGLEGRVLVVLSGPTDGGATEKSFRNLRRVRVAYAPSLGTYEVLAADRILLSEEALAVLSGGEPEPADPPRKAAKAEATADAEDRPEPDEDVPAEDQEVGE
jgi:large subunit ribosomal protein L4